MKEKLEAIFAQLLIWGFVAIVVLVPLGLLGSCVISIFTPPTKEQIADRQIAEAMVVIKNNLKDPDSAKFGNAKYTGKAVCGLVNAKNSFGGYTGMKRYVVTGTLVSMEGSPKFETLWKKACAD